MRTSLFVACLALLVLMPSTRAAAQSAQDKAIAQEIGSQLKTSGQLQDYRIGVKYKDGVAALSGTVSNQQQLITAVRLTQRMSNVSQVVNNLTVAGDAQSSGSARPSPNQKFATPTSFTAAGSQSPRAVRTSYQPSGPQNQGQYGQQPNQAYMGPRQAMGPQQSMGPGQAMGPQRPMSANRMQAPRRNNMPMPMGGRPPVQQAMAQQQQMQQPMQPPMGAMQAGCNCGPGGPGGGGYGGGGGMMGGPPAAMGYGGESGAVNYDNPQMPGYAWPSYASSPNYAALSYPKQYSPSAWPYIGPFYPYPQVPLGWRKVALEWDDGWWFLDFSDTGSNH